MEAFAGRQQHEELVRTIGDSHVWLSHSVAFVVTAF